MSPGEEGVVAPETFEIADSGEASAASSGPGGETCLYHSSEATYSIRSQGKVLAEYTTLYTNTPSYRYIYAGDQRIAMRTAPGTLYFYLNDHLGSVAVVVDSLAQVKDFIKYRAYGQTYAAQSVTGQDFSFTGHPLDEEDDMDLHYAGARYYDAILGRFCAVDPRAGEYPSHSPFNYADNNPLKNRDTDGEVVETVIDVISIGLSAKDMWDKPSWKNAGFLALDVIAAAVPFLPAIGAVRHSGKIADFFKNTERGLENEAKVLKAEGLEKNTKMIPATDPKTKIKGKTQPDAVRPSGQTVDIKDRQRLSDSEQLRRQSEISAEADKRGQVIVGKNTKVSKTIQNRMDVKRRDDIGPQQ